ncbi:hypothetical protein FQN54_009440 [Arachnomyces sp. PD_36]|nr:hypothetical protein FQN54_009440 [Arachnomyces sp. PD_36]
MADSLEDRLRSHAKAFDGLLSLIPAKYYYGEDTSDQWQRKKQTKEEARKAKRAKLDPDSSKTVKDVMDENARKRKREEDADKDVGEGQEGSGEEVLGSEKPGEGLNRGDRAPKKKKKVEKTQSEQDKPNGEEGAGGDAEARKKQKSEKLAAKREQKKEQRKAKAAAAKPEKKPESQPAQKPAPKTQKQDTKHEKRPKQQNAEPEAEEDDDNPAQEMDLAEGFSLDLPAEQHSSFASTPISNSPGLDTPNPHSGSSSISSIVPPTQPSELNKQPSNATNKPKPSPEELKQRLQKRLDELRAARHADGFNGKPARNRQELIEARRQREEQRRAHKKELRAKAKEEEQRLRDEAIAKRFSPSNSGSLLASPRSPAETSPTASSSPSNNFSFGRVAFSDGQQADPTLTNFETHRKRGPQDPATALRAAQNKKSRLAGLDDAKKADIEEKDRWLNAKRRAHGERVRDDTSLLKKTLKRKEGVKKKSEREWTDRIEGIAKGKEIRQNKRDENLRKRKEEKGGKGKKKGGSGKGKGGGRPGFEGSFKSKVGGKKK